MHYTLLNQVSLARALFATEGPTHAVFAPFKAKFLRIDADAALLMTMTVVERERRTARLAQELSLLLDDVAERYGPRPAAPSTIRAAQESNDVGRCKSIARLVDRHFKHLYTQQGDAAFLRPAEPADFDR